MGSQKSRAALWLVLGAVGVAAVLAIFWVLNAQIPAHEPVLPDGRRNLQTLVEVARGWARGAPLWTWCVIFQG